MFQISIEDAIEKLSELMRQRRKLDTEIGRLQTLLRTQASLRHSIGAPVPLAFSVEMPMGFTEAVREVLLTYRVWLSPCHVRDLLPTVGFEHANQRHELISVHTVLKRLVRSGAAVRDIGPGKIMYRWADARSSDAPSATISNQTASLGQPTL